MQVIAGNDAEPALEEALHRRSLLIVLDNFEHVLDAADRRRPILQRSPGVQVLATSRALLRIAGELVMDVHPLASGTTRPASRADAVALFEQLAPADRPELQLAHSLDDVVAICRAVDGLPLAIEMATGHLRTLPPALLRTRLHERLGRRSAPPATRPSGSRPSRRRSTGACSCSATRSSDCSAGSGSSTARSPSRPSSRSATAASATWSTR